MGRVRRRVVLAVGATAVVLTGWLVVARSDLGTLTPVADADLGRTATLRQVPTGTRGRLTAAQARVLREVRGAHRSGTTVVVPVTAATDGRGYERLGRRELAGHVLPLDVHVYTQPWDWTGTVPPTAPSLSRPAPGPVVGDLGPAYLGCRVLDDASGCVVVTMLRDVAGRWRVVDSWYVRFMGVDRWPNSPPIALQVRVYPDLSGTAGQYLVAGAVVGDPGSVQLRTARGAVESAAADPTVMGRGFWTFRAALAEPPETVTAYDPHGRAGPTWGVHASNP